MVLLNLELFSTPIKNMLVVYIEHLKDYKNNKRVCVVFHGMSHDLFMRTAYAFKITKLLHPAKSVCKFNLA